MCVVVYCGESGAVPAGSLILDHRCMNLDIMHLDIMNLDIETGTMDGQILPVMASDTRPSNHVIQHSLSRSKAVIWTSHCGVDHWV